MKKRASLVQGEVRIFTNSTRDGGVLMTRETEELETSVYATTAPTL